MNPALYRPGTSDANIWASVVDGDEYKLPQMGAKDVCIDIGANTGAATYAMLQKGAGKVIAFEPDPDNYILFRKQLKKEIKEGIVEVYPLAVVGGSGFQWRTFSGVVKTDGEINHGGAYIFSRDGSDPFGYGEFFMGTPFRVPSIGIRDILNMWPHPRLMKLDCEGAEFEIIESISCDSPLVIVGEYHPSMGCTASDLVIDLQNREYSTILKPHPNSELGLFFATRK